jgi:hypothetical protein
MVSMGDHARQQGFNARQGGFHVLVNFQLSGVELPLLPDKCPQVLMNRVLLRDRRREMADDGLDFLWFNPSLLRYWRGLAGPLAPGWGLLCMCLLTRSRGTGSALGILVQPYQLIHAHPQDTRNGHNGPYARLLAFPFANPLDRLDR